MTPTIDNCDQAVREDLGRFVRSFNEREWAVRIDRSHSFDSWAKSHDDPHHGTGLAVDGLCVPYFHPNRSFHDEIIWLNRHIFWDPRISFDNKLLNSAIVKFYGPSKTLEIATAGTGIPYVDFAKFKADTDYALKVLSNLEEAKARKEQLWGTTELRTSLQTAARNYCLGAPTQYDIVYPSAREPGKMLTSDMVAWIAHLGEKWVPAFKAKPDMEETFKLLTSTRGIGNYYGYHFGSNLARMPGLGHSELIMAEHTDDWRRLTEYQPGLSHGNISEDADYVICGPGSAWTIGKLWPELKQNQKSYMEAVRYVRDNQLEFFGIQSEDQARHHREATELGRYTAFGSEIACCQYSVYVRNRESADLARKRAAAPISKEIGDSCSGFDEFI